MKISQLNNAESLSKSLGLFQTPQVQNETSFKDMLLAAIENMSSLEKASEEYSLKLATGDLENIHEPMIAAQKAEITFQYMLQIRNKVLDAYREITRMQI